jgi:streptogramin lyase
MSSNPITANIWLLTNSTTSIADPQSDPGQSPEASIRKFYNNGKFVTSWRNLPVGDSEADTEHLAVDSEGYVYLPDRGNHRIQAYIPDQF